MALSDFSSGCILRKNSLAHHVLSFTERPQTEQQNCRPRRSRGKILRLARTRSFASPICKHATHDTKTKKTNPISLNRVASGCPPTSDSRCSKLILHNRSRAVHKHSSRLIHHLGGKQHVHSFPPALFRCMPFPGERIVCPFNQVAMTMLLFMSRHWNIVAQKNVM